MGLYDSVDRGKPKPKRLTGPIALCCALFLLFGGLTYWACHYQFRFHAFISDLTDSTRDARSTETFRVTVNGSETDVSIDDLSDLLYLIDKAGAGRTAAAPEEMPYAVIDYGDGSTLEIWKVELVNPYGCGTLRVLSYLVGVQLISVYRQSPQCGERSNAAISHAVCRHATVTHASR